MLEQLVSARASYAYPPVGLVTVERLHAPSTWEADLIERRFEHTLALDDHHRDLLHSADDADIVTGVFSVVYWGNITGGGLARARTRWVATGKAGRADESVADLGMTASADIVREARQHLARGDVEAALVAVTRLPYVRLSFGSKLLAFLDPERVGVLDEKITRHLQAGTFARVLGPREAVGLVGGKVESARRAAARYARFCAALADIRDAINAEGRGWQDASGASMPRFRAVDVERALFAMALRADGGR